MSRENILKRQLRSFGLIVGGGFTVIGLWPLVVRDEALREWALGLALLLSAAALVLPDALKLPFRIWMAIGVVLAWINTRILLSVAYYGLFVPMGVAFRVSGWDPMRRKIDRSADTYRVSRAKRPASHMLRQY